MLRARLNSAVLCAIAAAVVYSLFIARLLAYNSWNPANLVLAGDHFVDPRASVIPVIKDSDGYDGQFYYRIALNPFTRSFTQYGIRLDFPVYRHQRVMFPLLAWAITGGSPSLIPIAFVFINWIAAIALAWCAAKIVQSLDIHALWSAGAWIYPGAAASMSRDCVEVLMIAFLVAAMLALIRRRPGLAAILGSCAVLTKETALLATVGAAAGYFFIDRRRCWFLLAPLAVFAIFKRALFAWWHLEPNLGATVFTVPFTKMMGMWYAHGSSSDALRHVFALEILATLAIMVIGALSIRRNVLSAAWLPYLLLVSTLNEAIWVEDWAFLRASTELWVLGALLSPRIATVIAVATTLLTMWSLLHR